MKLELAVTKIISESWGGTIFAGKANDGRTFHVRAWSDVGAGLGDVFEVEGELRTYKSKWSEVHQIEATKLARVRTSGRLIVPWLMSLDGIGRERAERLFERFGGDLVPALSEPNRAGELAASLAPSHPNLGRKLAEYVQTQYTHRAAREETGVAEVAFLQKLEEVGIGNVALSRKLWRLIGSKDAYKRLLSRPYAMAAVLPWKDADAVGQRLMHAAGCLAPQDHDERHLGAVDAVWLRLLKRGNTAASQTDFRKALSRLGVVADKALALGLEHRRAMQGAGEMLRPPGAAFLEATVAAHFRRIAEAEALDAPQPDLQVFANITLNDDQYEAVMTLCRSQFGILQGGAGVGKTTALKALCEAHLAAGGSVLLTAISGKAALRLSRATGRLAYTVARLVHGLERRAALRTDAQAAPNHLPAIDATTLVVVDEASMVDLASWRRLLDLIPDGAKLTLVGDVAQLPPVGLGRVYHDLVEHGSRVCHLKQVMRQADGNTIIDGAAAIRAGRLPSVSSYVGSSPGLFHLEVPSPAIGTEALRIYRELLRNTSSKELLMLAARNDTCATIARSMQVDRQSQGRVGIRLGPLAQWVAEGDPVVATANRYDQGLMNGLIGWVEALEPLLVRFDGEAKAREVTGPARQELASAWCLTVHRAQGSEAKRVIVLLDGPTFITREWLYTAVTRGVEQVVLVGPREHLAMGVERAELRQTGFPIELAYGAAEPGRVTL